MSENQGTVFATRAWLMSPAVAAFGLVGCALASWTPPSAQGTVTPPSKSLSGNEFGTACHASTNGLLRMRAIYDSQTPEVVLQSSYKSPTRYNKVFSRIRTSYWPTCVRPIGNGILLVCGKGRRAGHTIVELWTLTPPSVPVFGTPDGSHGVVAGSVSDINPVYDGNTPGRMIVKEAVPFWGSSVNALIQFEDSSDLYSMNLSTGALAMIASPDAGRAVAHGAATVPLLAQTTGAFAGELAAGPYVYQFTNRSAASSTPSRVMFFDLNRDGTIDSNQVLSAAQWSAAGYGAGSAWTKH